MKRVVWIFRNERAGLQGRDTEYAATLPTQGVLRWMNDPAYAADYIEQAGFTPRADWLPRTEPEDIAVHTMAAKLYAAVYAASMNNPPELTRDSARNVTSQLPADVARWNAERAVAEWRHRFYPETLPPPHTYGATR